MLKHPRPFGFKKATCAVAAAAVAAIVSLGAGGAAPPADLLKLEKLVSLKIAHQRISAARPDAEFLKLLSEAQRLQLKGEKALQAGDYPAAEDAFIRANTIVSQLGN